MKKNDSLKMHLHAYMRKVVDKKSYLIPLEYPDKVDMLRKEIGLSPLAEELAEEGRSWNLEEYKKNLPAIEERYRAYSEKRIHESGSAGPPE